MSLISLGHGREEELSCNSHICEFVDPTPIIKLFGGIMLGKYVSYYMFLRKII